MTTPGGKKRIAVVGGGLAGLSAAHALAGASREVVVYEASDRLGGRAITDTLEGVSVDPGAQLFSSSYTRFLDLVRGIGLGERLVKVPGRDALWRDGRAHEVVYGSVPSMVTSGGLPLLTKMKLGAKYVPYLVRHAASLDVHAPERAADGGLDAETIADWGHREIDSTFIESLVYPQLGAYYGSTPEDTSAGFYHILGHQGLDLTLYAVNGGVGQVADRLASRIVSAGGEVRASASVQRIVLDDEGAIVVSPMIEERFDAVVCALPVPDLLPILAGAPPDAAEWLAKVQYRPALTLALLLREPAPGRYFGLSFPRSATRHLAVIAHQEHKGVPLGAGGGVMIVFPKPEITPELIDLDSREILDRLLPEITRVYPEIERAILRARVYRWPSGTPEFPAGSLGRLRLARGDRLLGSAPMALAGDYLYGPTVEGAVQSGLEAAERLTRLLSS